MALDSRSKRAAAAHVKRLAKGVTPNAFKPGIWRGAVGWNYFGQDIGPVTSGIEYDKITLGTKESLSVTNTPVIGGPWSW